MKAKPTVGVRISTRPMTADELTELQAMEARILAGKETGIPMERVMADTMKALLLLRRRRRA